MEVPRDGSKKQSKKVYKKSCSNCGEKQEETLKIKKKKKKNKTKKKEQKHSAFQASYLFFTIDSFPAVCDLSTPWVFPKTVFALRCVEEHSEPLHFEGLTVFQCLCLW